MSEPMERVSLYCSCGASWRMALPVSKIALFKQEWQEIHSGEGHKPCSPIQASRAKQKVDREFLNA